MAKTMVKNETGYPIIDVIDLAYNVPYTLDAETGKHRGLLMAFSTDAVAFGLWMIRTTDTRIGVKEIAASDNVIINNPSGGLGYITLTAIHYETPVTIIWFN